MSFMSNYSLKTSLRENLNNTLFQFPQDQDVDSLVNEFTNIIIKVSRKVIKIKNRQYSKKKQRSTMQNKKWFDKSCHLLKNELRNLGRRASIYPKKCRGGDGLQTRKVRRYATRNFFLNFGTLKRYSQRFGGTYKVILQCA